MIDFHGEPCQPKLDHHENTTEKSEAVRRLSLHADFMTAKNFFPLS